MKTITLLGLAGIAFFSLAQPTWAGPRGGGAALWRRPLWRWRPRRRLCWWRLSRRASLSTVAAFEQHRLSVAVVHTLPVEVSADQVVAPRFYYGGNRMSAVRPQGFTPLSRSVHKAICRQVAAATRQPNSHELNCHSEPCDQLARLFATATSRQPNRVGSE